MTENAGGGRFVRDGLTWLGYLVSATPTYTLATFGPFMPFLQSEMHLSYTMAALHFTAWASGGLFAGCVGDRVMARLGHIKLMWLASFGIVIAISALIVAHLPALTIASAAVAGLMASLLGMTITSLMSDRFGSERTVGFIEANIIASTFCLCAPLVVSLCVHSGIGWRAALVIPMALLMSLFLVFRSHGTSPTVHATSAAPTSGHGKMPIAYWSYWFVILLTVAAEWSVIFWSPEFLHKTANFAKADAAAAAATFLFAMLGGRLLGRILAQRVPVSTLLPITSVVALAGFLLFWLGPGAAFKLLGLAITGLGISNFFPLTMAAALDVVPDKTITASARVSVSCGLAVLSAPLVLGFVADHTNIFTAYGVIACILVLCIGMVLIANNFARTHAATRLAVVPSQVA